MDFGSPGRRQDRPGRPRLGGSHQQAVGAAIIGGEVAGACQRRVNLRRRAGQRHRGAISQKIGKAEQSSRPRKPGRTSQTRSSVPADMA